MSVDNAALTMINNLRSYHAACLKQVSQGYAPVKRALDDDDVSLTSLKDDIDAMENSVDKECHRLKFSNRWSDSSWSK